MRACRQSEGVVARVCELGRAGTSVAQIVAALSAEGFRTSTGTPWLAKNDGRVVVRARTRGWASGVFSRAASLACAHSPCT